MSRYPNRDRALRQLDRHHTSWNPGGVVMPPFPVDMVALNTSLAMQQEEAQAALGVLARTMRPLLEGLRGIGREIDQSLYV